MPDKDPQEIDAPDEELGPDATGEEEEEDDEFEDDEEDDNGEDEVIQEPGN